MKAGDRGSEILGSLEETKWPWLIANGTPAKGQMIAHFGLFQTSSEVSTLHLKSGMELNVEGL